MLYFIVAKSGAGKDYACNKLCKELNLTTVKSRTTRHPRYIGEDTHLFVSSEQADIEYPRGIARTVFHGNRYYVLEEDLINKDLYIIDPKGVENYKGVQEFKTIYLDVPWYKRAYNMLFKRKDGLIDTIGRLLHDKKMFENFEADITIHSVDELFSLFKQEII